jgi:purine-binding chemotaxis protein CheW
MNATEEILQFVTFKIGNEEYGINILKVQEINRMVDITPVPNSPHYIEGVMNLRGKVIPVINLRRMFGLDDKEWDNTSRIIVVDVGIILGMIVDSVSEVLRIPSNVIDPPPSMTTNISSEHVKGIGKLDDRLLILIDIDRLFKEDLSIKENNLITQ